jgi:hypothetical protein
MKKLILFLSLITLILSPDQVISQSLQLFYPAGGEVFAGGTTETIVGEATAVNNVRIEFSSNNGATWSLVAIEPVQFGFLFYDWAIPSIFSTTCLIRISDASNSAVNSISGTFEIGAGNITIFYPFAGVNFVQGAMESIIWQSSGPQFLHIEFSSNGGGTWQTLATNYDATIGSYDWLIPSITSSNCLVRLTDVNNASITATSDLFSIGPQQPPDCAVNLSPANTSSNQTLSLNFSWEYQGAVGATGYDFYFGTNPNPSVVATAIPETDYLVTGLTPNTTYYWQVVPVANGVGASNCPVYSFTTGSGIGEIIMSQGTVSTCSGVFYDSGGSGNYFNGDYQIQTLQSNQPGQVVRATFSQFDLENGYDFLSIYDGPDENFPLIGTFTGNVLPPVVTASNTQGALTFEFSSDFIISAPGWRADISCVPAGSPSLTLTNPDGGEVLVAGATFLITWNSAFVSSVNLDWSSNNGSTWQSIAANYTNVGSYSWLVPNSPGNQMLIRVSDASNATLNDASNAVFSIVLPSILLVQPNGGEVLTGGDTYVIQWNAQVPSGMVDVEFSDDGGINWNYILFMETQNFYVWTVPNNPSSQCLIRISDSFDATIFDESDAEFTILPAPSAISLFNPFSGAQVVAGTTYNIQWTSTSVDDVKIEYSSNGGASFSVLATVPATPASYTWQVPSSTTNQAVIKVSDDANPAIFDESGLFEINNQSITVTAPNGGEFLNIGSLFYITWNSFGLNNVRIEYTSTGGTTWIPIVNNYFNSGWYAWTVPNVTSSNCKVRVMNNSIGSIMDESDAFFSMGLAPASLTLTQPNGGQTFVAGSQQLITWNSTSVSTLRIELSTNGGTSWNLISANSNASFGSFFWTVPNTPSANCLIRIADANNLSMNDVSDAVFTILSSTPVLEVIYPNGGEYFTENTGNWILWNSNNVGSVDLYFSIDNGLNWNVINTGISQNQYYWMVPNTLSNQCLVKVESPSAFLDDVSDAVFEIGQSIPNSNVITVDAVSSLNICREQEIDVTYTATGVFNPGNIFTAEMSDATGSL